MDFALSEDQLDASEVFGRVLDKVSSIERVRAVEEDGWDPEAWEAVMDMGALDFIHDEAGRARAVEYVLVCEILGAHLACIPFIGVIAGAEVLRSCAAEGEESAQVDERERILFGVRAADRGQAIAVPGGAAAEGLIVLDADELVLVRGGRREPVRDIGFSGAATWKVDEPATRTVLACGEAARNAWRRGLTWWRLGAAALSVGIGARVLQIGVDYAKIREQFGAPIGAFQAVQHNLADVLLDVEGARLLVREAAWLIDRDQGDGSVHADAAFAYATEIAPRAAEVSLHVHGGYGYTLDYDPQLFLRRAKGLQLQGGDPEEIWTAVGAAVMAAVD